MLGCATTSVSERFLVVRFFVQVYGTTVAFQWAAYWVALALACACPTAAVALGAFPGLLSLCLFISGFNVPIDNPSPPLKVLSSLSPCRWPSRAC